MRFERQGGVLVLHLEASDEPSDVRSAENAVDDDELTKIVVDCRRVDIISIAIIGAMVLLGKRTLMNGLPTLTFRFVKRCAKEEFMTTGLHRLFDFEE